MDRWVVNAFPLICLAKAGYTDFLLELPDEIIVPHAADDETGAGQLGDPARKAINTGKYPVADVSAPPTSVQDCVGLSDNIPPPASQHNSFVSLGSRG